LATLFTSECSKCGLLLLFAAIDIALSLVCLLLFTINNENNKLTTKTKQTTTLATTITITTEIL
jgi:hypothetical protein